MYEYNTTKIIFTCLFQNIEDDTKDLKWYMGIPLVIYLKSMRFFLLILLKYIAITIKKKQILIYSRYHNVSLFR